MTDLYLPPIVVPAPIRRPDSQVKPWPGGEDMRGDLSWATEPILANPAFLPTGKGALILILGGLVMLAVTAILARVMAGPPAPPAPSRTDRTAVVRRKPSRPRSRPPSTGRAGAGASTRKPGASTRKRGAQWADGLERAVQAKHRGAGRVTSADRTRCFFVLDDCRSCRHHRKRRDGCERERASIQKAVQGLAPRARVVEKSCNPARKGVCIFEIRRHVRA